MLRRLIPLLLLFAGSTLAQQDPNDQGNADSVFLTVTAQDTAIYVSLYFYRDVEALMGASCGFSWDNPNAVLVSVETPPEIVEAFDIRLYYYRNRIDSSNARKKFQFVGISMYSGLSPSTSPILIATYKFHVLRFSTGDDFCISVDSSSTPFRFVNTPDEYKPEWRGTSCLMQSGLSDFDADGVYDFVDNCPYAYNPQQLDDDRDGVGDACERSHWYVDVDSEEAPWDGSEEHPFQRIQDAFDLSSDGDTVEVASGTYSGDGNRDIDFGGRNIYLTSAAGPEVTIIDCGGNYDDPHRGFYFHTGEDSTATVNGFSIINGYNYYGSAIGCNEAGATISNNIIESNAFHEADAAIDCRNSSQTIIVVNNVIRNNQCAAIHYLPFPPQHHRIRIEGNTISGNTDGISLERSQFGLVRGNTISDNRGNGLSCSSVGGTTTIEGNLISGNIGTGISCSYTYALIDGNTIQNNESGGIFCEDSSPDIVDNDITNNRSSLGGGISCRYDSDPTIRSNRIKNNSAQYGGGGVMCFDGPVASIVDNVFCGNLAQFGAALLIEGAGASLSGNTFVGNVANTGSSLYVRTEASVTIDHTICAFNMGGANVDFVPRPGNSLTFTNADLFGNQGGDWVGPIASQLGTNGNIALDPLFCDTANGDYHISAFSPCAPGVQPNVTLIGALPVGCHPFQIGDVNGNGSLEWIDLKMLADFYFGLSNTWPLPLAAGDMNCDGVISINDLATLAGYIGGYGPAPCAPPPPKWPDQTGLDSDLPMY